MASHRVDRYAEAVLDREILAGPLVRLACERHRRDRQRAKVEPRWYQFSMERADLVLDFFETVLVLPDVVDEDGQPQPFGLLGCWPFVLGSLFGWIDEEGRRRFREGYIEAGKGSNKTPILAGVGLYGMVVDGERAAEIYAAGSIQDQSDLLFRDAVRMAQASPALRAELAFDGREQIWQIRHPESLSFFTTFSREGGRRSGPRPQMGLVDELHEHASAETSVKMRAGAKRRRQPLFLETTNSGFDRTSICWQRHEHARRIVEQLVTDDQLFAYVCALDACDQHQAGGRQEECSACDQPLVDETCWPKTNPLLPVTPTPEYLRRQVANAVAIQAETNAVLRLNFCVWTSAYNRAIDIAKWWACLPLPDEATRRGVAAFGCLDLGETDDLSAWGVVWPFDDGRLAVQMRYFLPRAALEAKPNRPYGEWERAGRLTVTPGDVTDYAVVRAAIEADCLAWGIRSVFYDSRSARETAQMLQGKGIDCVPMLQGFQLTEAITRLLTLVTTGQLCHGGDPILAWMASNVVLLTGTRKDRRLAKEKSPEKIDGIAALVMGIEGALIRRERTPEPQYQVMFFGGRR